MTKPISQEDLNDRADNLIRSLEHHIIEVQKTIAEIRAKKGTTKCIQARWILANVSLHALVVSYNVRCNIKVEQSR